MFTTLHEITISNTLEKQGIEGDEGDERGKRKKKGAE